MAEKMAIELCISYDMASYLYFGSSGGYFLEEIILVYLGERDSNMSYYSSNGSDSDIFRNQITCSILQFLNISSSSPVSCVVVSYFA